MGNNTREVAAKILEQVIKEDAYANLELNKALTTADFDQRDRRFITNLVYGSLKRWNAVDYQLEQFLNKPLKKKDAFLGILLHIAIFELLFTATPPRAAVNECVKLAKKYGYLSWGNLANGVLRNVVRNQATIKWPHFSSKIEKALFFQSLPAWLGELWMKERGEEETLLLLESFDQVRPISFRVNSLKTNRDEILKMLAAAGLQGEAGKYSPYCIKSQEGSKLLRLPEHKMGYYTVQEEGSQLAVLALAPKAGETVLDLCAAPGGKTAFIAQLMENQGKIMASDVYEHKVRLIDNNAERLGITIINAFVKDGTTWGDTDEGVFDRVLLDAPCSGLGVLSRRQDARFHKRAADINSLQTMQRKLIDAAVRALKIGGRMVFSTCTLTQSENQENREYILDKYHNMIALDLRETLPKELSQNSLAEGWLELLPHVHETDGFYIAAFEKVEK